MPENHPSATEGFEAWREDLLAASEIVQDGDESVPPGEAEVRFSRYIELLDSVSADDPDEVFMALYESLDDREDYGAYETLLGRLAIASPERRGRHAVAAIPALLRRAPEQAGNVLGQIAFDPETSAAFNAACAAHDDPHDLEALAQYIAEQEEDEGWLSTDRQRGRLRPLPKD